MVTTDFCEINTEMISKLFQHYISGKFPHAEI